MALGGYEEAGESFVAHEDDLLLRSGFVGVVRIALIFSGKRTSMDYPLRLQGTRCGGR